VIVASADRHFGQPRTCTAPLAGAPDALTSFEVRSDGSADIALEGTAGRLTVDLDGSGDADLAGLAAREARVAVGGSGGVDVRAAERLDVELDGSGDVRYHGDPVLTQRVDGSGELTRAR
jgi:Putative auto-transporter adhesin, head GIN domain